MAKTKVQLAKNYMKKAKQEQLRAEDEKSTVMEELEREPEDMDGDGLIDIDSDWLTHTLFRHWFFFSFVYMSAIMNATFMYKYIP